MTIAISFYIIKLTWKKISLEARTTRDMAEKKEVMIKAVLEPSNRLLKGKINGYQSHSLIGRYWTQTYETTNGKMGETIDAAVSGRLTSMLSITDITLISPSGRISTICSIRTLTMRDPYIWDKRMRWAKWNFYMQFYIHRKKLVRAQVNICLKYIAANDEIFGTQFLKNKIK